MQTHGLWGIRTFATFLSSYPTEFEFSAALAGAPAAASFNCGGGADKAPPMRSLPTTASLV
jgi:hypothetical protein